MKKLFVPAIAVALAASACGADDEASDIDNTAASTASPATESPATDEPAASSVDSQSTPSSAGASGPATGEPIRIGFTNVDEGAAGFPGYTEGAKLGVEYINKDLGGVDGRPIELVVCSQLGDEASAAQCGQEFANDDSLTAIMTGFQFFGGPFYAATASTGRVVVGTLPLTEGDYGASGVWFWSSGSVGQLGAEAIFAATELGAKRIGTVYVDNPAGQAGADLVRSIVGKTDAEVVAVPVPQGASDYAPAITAAGGADVDAFLLLVDTTGCIGVAKALDQLGLDAAVVGSASCQGETVRDAVGDKMDGWYFGEAGPTPLLGEGLDPAVDQYLKAFENYATFDSPMKDFAYWAFGQMLAVKDLMEQVGVDDLTPETFDAAVEAFEGPVPLGAANISCPGTTVPNVCTSDGWIFQFEGERVVDVLGGEPIVVDKSSGS